MAGKTTTGSAKSNNQPGAAIPPTAALSTNAAAAGNNTGRASAASRRPVTPNSDVDSSSSSVPQRGITSTTTETGGNDPNSKSGAADADSSHAAATITVPAGGAADAHAIIPNPDDVNDRNKEVYMAYLEEHNISSMIVHALQMLYAEPEKPDAVVQYLKTTIWGEQYLAQVANRHELEQELKQMRTALVDAEAQLKQLRVEAEALGITDGEQLEYTPAGAAVQINDGMPARQSQQKHDVDAEDSDQWSWSDGDAESDCSDFDYFDAVWESLENSNNELYHRHRRQISPAAQNSNDADAVGS